MRPHDVVSNKRRHQDSFPDNDVPLGFLVGKIPEIVSGDDHRSVLGGVVQDECVVVAGYDLVVELPTGGVDQVPLLFQSLQLSFGTLDRDSKITNNYICIAWTLLAPTLIKARVEI